MNERLIQMTYNAYEQHLTILIDHNHHAFSRYSTIVQYLDEPFSVWADKIVGLLCAEINESPFILEYTGRAEEAEILSFFAEKCAKCVRFEHVLPKVNTSQQDRMYQLNQLVKRVSCQSVSVTNILIYTDGSFSEAEQNTISEIASINNRYCRMKVSSEDALTDSALSCRFCSFDSLDSALEKDEAGQIADYTLYFVRGVQNRFCGIKSGCTWIYEFDGTDDMFVQLLIKCLFVFPLLRVMRLCVQSLTVRPEIKDELLKITSIEPMLFITADDTVEVGRSIPVVLSMQSAGYPVLPIVCEFEREGIVEYRNNRFHGIKKGKTVARFYIRGDLKPAAVLNINAIERNRIKDLLLSETEIVLPENSNYAWSTRTNTPSDSKIMQDARKTLNTVNDAMRIIGNKNKRAQYDAEWEARKANGMLETVATIEAASIIERAVKYFQEGNLVLAEKFAREALQADSTNITAHDVLSETLFGTDRFTEAVNFVKSSLEVFHDTGNKLLLLEKLARYHYIGTKDFNASQQAVNEMVEMGSYMGSVKQVLLYLFMGKEALAMEEIQKYQAANAETTAFRREVAYGMLGYATMQIYVMDPSNKAYAIISKESAETNLRLAEKALSLYDDDTIKEWTEDARYHLTKVFNADNKLGVVLWWILSILTVVMVFTMGIVVLIPAVIFVALSIFMTWGSFEPIWTIERRQLTGKRGLAGSLCDILGKYILWSFKMVGKTFRFIFRISV